MKTGNLVTFQFRVIRNFKHYSGTLFNETHIIYCESEQWMNTHLTKYLNGDFELIKIIN